MLGSGSMALRYVKFGWIIAGVMVLLTTIYFFDGEQNSDIDVFLIWLMLALSFPGGIVCALIFSGFAYVLYQATAMTVPTTYLSILLFWAVFFVVGYWQWFVLVPRLVKRFKGS